MTRIALVAGGDLGEIFGDFDFFVGVDRGALTLIDNALPLHLAVGDFDSVSKQEFQSIKNQAEEVVLLLPEKDDTDMDFALKEVFHRYPEAHITIFGAFGGRMDHTLSNVFIPSNPDLTAYMRQISLRDARNLLCYFPEGWHQVEALEEMTYVAFMPSESIELIIEDAKYPLDKRNFFMRKVYTSNEFIGKPIRFYVEKGYVVVIYSKDA